MKLILLLLSFTVFIFPQIPSENFRIFPGAVTQTEPVVSISKSDPRFFFVSAVTINTATGFKSEGVYISTDGGINWRGSDTCKGQLLVNHGGDPGIVITGSGRLVLTHNGSIFPGSYSHYSDDTGKTWTYAYTINSNQTEDKGTTIYDDNSSSPFYNRIYHSFVNIISPYPARFAYSTDSGESWSQVQSVNNPPSGRSSGTNMALGSDGKLYMCWATVTANAPFTEDYTGFAVSENGGVTWNVTNNIFDMSGINGTLPEKNNIRVNGLPKIAVDRSGGPRNGWIYILTGEKNLFPAGSDPDIILRRSTDGGATWSLGIRVNQDPVNNGKIQYFGAIDIDDEGGLNVIFCDDRNTSSDSSEVWLARSADGGDTWTEMVLSDHRFQPKPIVGGFSNYQGDHISVISSGSRIHAFWMDDHSGIYQIWSKIINIPQSLSDESGIFPGGFQVEQNYPNPFNPSTRISFTLPVRGDAVVIISDLNGSVISEETLNDLPPGRHSYTWNASKQASGIYFYTIKSGASKITKKMVLIR